MNHFTFQLRLILDFERSRNQRQGSEFFQGSGIHEVEFMRWFPDAFLIDGVLKVARGGIALKTPVWRVHMLNHHATAPHISRFEMYKTYCIISVPNNENRPLQSGVLDLH